MSDKERTNKPEGYTEISHSKFFSFVLCYAFKVGPDFVEVASPELPFHTWEYGELKNGGKICAPVTLEAGE